MCTWLDGSQVRFTWPCASHGHVHRWGWKRISYVFSKQKSPQFYLNVDLGCSSCICLHQHSIDFPCSEHQPNVPWHRDGNIKFTPNDNALTTETLGRRHYCKRKDKTETSLYPSGQRLRGEMACRAAPPHCYCLTQVRNVPRKVSSGSLLVDFWWWVGGQSQNYKGSTYCRCFQHILDYLLLINRLNTEERLWGNRKY